MQQSNNKSFSGGMSAPYRGSRSNQGSNGNVSHHGGHGSNRRGDHRHSPDSNNNTGGNQGRFVHGGGRGEMNGRSSHGGHGGHGGGGYGNRGSFLPRDQTRASPTQPNQHFVSRNHKEIVDFFQQNFDLIKDQTVNVSGQKVVAGTSRKTIYYQPPPTPSPTVTPSKAGSY